MGVATDCSATHQRSLVDFRLVLTPPQVELVDVRVHGIACKICSSSALRLTHASQKQNGLKQQLKTQHSAKQRTHEASLFSNP
jgi:hypothetical protein